MESVSSGGYSWDANQSLLVGFIGCPTSRIGVCCPPPTWRRRPVHPSTCHLLEVHHESLSVHPQLAPSADDHDHEPHDIAQARQGKPHSTQMRRTRSLTCAEVNEKLTSKWLPVGTKNERTPQSSDDCWSPCSAESQKDVHKYTKAATVQQPLQGVLPCRHATR